MTEPLLDFSSAPPRQSPSAPPDRVVLLDANNLAARSFHAAKGRMTAFDESRSETVETGSLHLFCISLSKFLRDLKPSHFVVCWDGGRSVHREKIYPEYKAARRAGHPDGEPPHAPAFALIGEFLDLCGLEQWYQPGVEADDLIAAAHRITRAQYPDRLITIMSSDKDMLQLLDDRTDQLRFSSYGTPTDVWTRSRVIADLGYSPERIPFMMAFTGDTSDGVPGAKGIGPKKALKLLTQCGWDFETAAQAVPDSPMVWTSYDLVNLLGDLCCEVDPVPLYDPLTRSSKYAQARLAKLTDFCARYQLRELWQGVVDGTLWW